jgi:hypothetical protein
LRQAEGLNRKNIFNILRIEPFGSIPPQAERLDLKGSFETTSEIQIQRPTLQPA